MWPMSGLPWLCRNYGFICLEESKVKWQNLTKYWGLSMMLTLDLLFYHGQLQPQL